MISTNKTNKNINKSNYDNQDPEVKKSPRPHRRYSASYKLKILEMADACKSERGGVGRLLRTEGLYSNMLSEWRKARDNGMLTALSPKRRGVKPKEINPLESRVIALERSKLELEKRLEISQKIIEAQKKIAEIFTSVNPSQCNEKPL
jgi:transposase